MNGAPAADQSGDPGAQEWPVATGERYEARLSDDYRAIYAKVPERRTVLRGLLIGGASGVVALLVAVALGIRWAIHPASASFMDLGVIFIATLLGIGAIVVVAKAPRTLFARPLNPHLPQLTPYGFAITPTAIEFPATMYSPAAQWPRESTTAIVTGTGGTETLKLTCPGQETRSFGSGLADPLEDLAARISPRAEGLR